ncbi:MAG: ribulose-phosphate 3-epimerase [Candidatus Hodarchaeales archaeon]
MVEIVPSILSANFAHLANEISKIEPFVNWLHIDIMDGHFVPNLTIGPVVLRAIRSVSQLELDVHLMIQHPIRYIDTFIDAGADNVTIHLEAEENDNIVKIIDKVHSRGKNVGLSIKSDTPASSLYPFLKKIDLILCMTVEPGFGGQKFLHETIGKIREISDMIKYQKNSIILQVDGGITKKTAPLVVEAGATVLVAGSAIFGHENPALAISEMLDTINV